MLELTPINTTELVNKKLGTQLNNIKKAVETGNNQQWKIADAIATIVDNELFIDDFGSEKNIASVLGMSRSNLNKMKNASHYHKEVSELNAFTLSKVMELLVIPKEDIVSFLDEYMVTASSTVREVRDSVSDWKDENIVADAEITDTKNENDVNEATDEDSKNENDVNEATDEDSKNENDVNEATDEDLTLSTFEAVLKMVDRLEMEELVALMDYIEKRL